MSECKIRFPELGKYEVCFGPTPPVVIDIGDIGNSYGGLVVKEDGGLFFWGIKDYYGIDWEEIPKSLFDELVKYNDEFRLSVCFP